MTDVVITGMASVVPGPATESEAGHPGGVHRVEAFDPVALFGRRTSRFNHRSTLLMMAACEAALADAGLAVTDESRDAIGITVGTTVGSVAGTVEFGVDTFDRNRPYLVNAACFPNMVMNTAAGALAIRFGARGANSTVVGGPLAGVAALRQAQVALRAGHIDAVLAGASDEATEATVWWARAARPTAAVGEGAAMFVLERRESAEAAGRAPIARLGAAAVRTVDPADATALAGAVTRALATAGLAPDAVGLVAVRATGVAAVDRAQREALRSLGDLPLLWSEDEMGDCYSAHSALQLAGVIERLTREPDGAPRAGLVVTVDPDGAVGTIATVCVPSNIKELTHS